MTTSCGGSTKPSPRSSGVSAPASFPLPTSTCRSRQTRLPLLRAAQTCVPRATA
jgi:hypothetical protein